MTNVTQGTQTTIRSDKYVEYNSLVGLTALAEGFTRIIALDAKVNHINGNLKINIGGTTKSVDKLVYAECNTVALTNEQGDSGCIVYMQGTVNGQNVVNNHIGGVLSSSVINNSTGEKYMVFSSAELILNDLGATLY